MKTIEDEEVNDMDSNDDDVLKVDDDEEEDEIDKELDDFFSK